MVINFVKIKISVDYQLFSKTMIYSCKKLSEIIKFPDPEQFFTLNHQSVSNKIFIVLDF